MEKILDVLFNKYVEGCLKGINPLTPGDLEQPFQLIEEFEKNKNMNLQEAVNLEAMIGECTYISEKCGFLNGVKVGFRLCREMNKDSIQ